MTDILARVRQRRMPDVVAYKRTVSRAGRWPWQPFDDSYSNAFAHGTSGDGSRRLGVTPIRVSCWRCRRHSSTSSKVASASCSSSTSVIGGGDYGKSQEGHGLQGGPVADREAAGDQQGPGRGDPRLRDPQGQPRREEEESQLEEGEVSGPGMTQCPVCGQRMAAGSLSSHMRRKHPKKGAKK